MMRNMSHGAFIFPGLMGKVAGARVLDPGQNLLSIGKCDGGIVGNLRGRCQLSFQNLSDRQL